MLGIEGNFDWLSKFSFDSDGPASDVEFDVLSTTVDFKLFLPKWQNGQFYLLAGPGLIRAESDATGSRS